MALVSFMAAPALEDNSSTVKGELSSLPPIFAPVYLPCIVKVADNSDNPADLKALVQEGLRATGLSARAAAIKAGLPPSRVRDILNGKSQNPRFDTIRPLLQLFESAGVDIGSAASVADNATGTSLFSPHGNAEFVRLPIAHKVEAGSWHEVEDMHEPLGWRTVPAHPGFPHARQWLEEVVGDSMDLLIRPGSLVHVIDIADAGYTPVDGDIVVVVRTRAGFLERTLKQLVIERGEGGRQIRSLVPRSTNPRHTAPVMREGDEPETGTEEVQIVGLVVQDFRIWK